MKHYENKSLESINYFCDFDLVWKIEQWRDIPDYTGYQASDLGRIKSLERMVKGQLGLRKQYARILSNVTDKYGYHRTTLSKNGKGKNHLVHALVAYAFLNHKPSKYKGVVDHSDNNILNNKANNLQVITQRKNTSKDRFRVEYSSKYLGVTWCKQTSRWRSAIYIDGKSIHLGRFHCEIEASEAYQKALQLHNQKAISH